MSAQHTQRAEVRALIAAARAQGWTVKDCSSGHVKLMPPCAALGFVVAPKTGSDWRGLQNTVGQLRRRGLVVEKGKAPR